MALPNFSPASGIGTVWSDPQTGTTYRFSGSGAYGGWEPISQGVGQISTPAPAITGINTTQNLLNSLNRGGYSAPSGTSGGGDVYGGYEDIFAMLGLGGGGGGDMSGLDPNNADSIKQYYPGYAGWNDRAAIVADFKATGGAGKEGGGGGGGAFNFDWEQAEKDALEKLRPYYEEKLREAEGDVNLAKARIEEDYQQGKRYREEDLAVEKEGWQMQEPRELNELLEQMNRRNMLQSTIRTGEEGFLTDTQRRRREAVERGLRRREEVAGVEKGRGIEDINIQFPRFKRELEEEKKQRALDLAGTQQQKQYQKYIAEAQRFIR